MSNYSLRQLLFSDIFVSIDDKEGKQAIREAVAPRVTELIDHSQRAKLQPSYG